MSPANADRTAQSAVRSAHRYRLGVNVDPTAAELAVLRCAADGHTVPETALLLAKGETTVKNQLMRARLKLGAKNTAHAVAIALRRHLID